MHSPAAALLGQISELESGQDDTDEMDLLQSSLSDLKDKLAAAVAENSSLNEEMESAITKVVETFHFCTPHSASKVALVCLRVSVLKFALIRSCHDCHRRKPQR